MDEVKFLNKTIREIDDEIASLRERQRRLRSRTNDIMSPLPPEVLAGIFRLAATTRGPTDRCHTPPYISLQSLLQIGAVCSQWRRVAWSTPLLWPECFWSLQSEHRPVHRLSQIPEVVDMALQNANGIPISISATPSQLWHCAHIFFGARPVRIKALGLYTVLDRQESLDWNHLAPLLSPLSQFPDLAELWLDSPGRLDGEDLLFRDIKDCNMLPKPRVTILHTPLISWRIPFGQLTVLRLQNMSAGYCIHLLINCPNLIEYHCYASAGITDCYDSPPILSPSERPMMLTNMQVFRWHDYNEEWSDFLFLNIRFPSVTQLYLERGTEFSLPSSVSRKHFIPSFTSLTTLYWGSCIDHMTPKVYTYLCGTSFDATLQEFHLSLTYGHRLTAWMDYLTLVEASATDVERRNLPNLRIIYVETNHLQETFAGIFNFLCSRRNRPLSNDPGEEDRHKDGPWDAYWADHTRLEKFVWEAFAGAQLTEEQKAMLKPLIDGGLVFEVQRCI